MKVLSKQEKKVIFDELKQLDKAERRGAKELKKQLRGQHVLLKASEKELRDAKRIYLQIVRRADRISERIDKTKQMFRYLAFKEAARIERRRLVLEGRLS